MKPTITRFNDKTGDFEITIPVPFTLKDGIEYADMIVVDIPKYEDTKDYNVFDLIRENQELKKQLEVGKEQYNDLVEEKEKIQEQLSSNTLQFENQQKEFIEWLESNLEALEMCDRELILTNNKKEIKAYKEVLSKYKEIIGGSNDKTNKKLGRIKQSSSKR